MASCGRRQVQLAKRRNNGSRRTGRHSLLLFRILEGSTCVEDAQVVDVLDVARMEIKPCRVLLGCKVQRVQRLGLGLRDGRDVGRSWQAPVAGEAASRILDDEPFRGRAGGGLVMQQWSGCVRPACPAESVWLLSVPAHIEARWLNHVREVAYSSAAHGSARVRMRSGLVAASSL